MPTEGVPIASQLKSEGGAQTASCWYKKMSGGATAAILLNTGADAATITCSLSDLMVTGKPKPREYFGIFGIIYTLEYFELFGLLLCN